MAKRKSKDSEKAPPTNGKDVEIVSSKAVIGRANVNRRVEMSPSFVSLYSNDTQVQTTPWDFRLIFGEITDLPTVENPTARVKQIGEVRMSPQQMKALVEILVGQLTEYEKRFGVIPTPL